MEEDKIESRTEKFKNSHSWVPIVVGTPHPFVSPLSPSQSSWSWQHFSRPLFCHWQPRDQGHRGIRNEDKFYKNRRQLWEHPNLHRNNLEMNGIICNQGQVCLKEGKGRPVNGNLIIAMIQHLASTYCVLEISPPLNTQWPQDGYFSCTHAQWEHWGSEKLSRFSQQKSGLWPRTHCHLKLSLATCHPPNHNT